MRETTREIGQGQTAFFGIEHYFGWLAAIGAIVLGVLGWLEGLGITTFVHTTDGTSTSASNLMYGAIFFIPAFAAGAIAYAFHSTSHHLAARVDRMGAADRGMWGMEHGLAYIAGLGGIGLGAVGMLTSFGLFNDSNPLSDGLIWEMAALASGILTFALHSVYHHQVEAEEDYLLSMVEGRVGTRTTTRAPMAGETTTQRYERP